MSTEIPRHSNAVRVPCPHCGERNLVQDAVCPCCGRFTSREMEDRVILARAERAAALSRENARRRERITLMVSGAVLLGFLAVPVVWFLTYMDYRSIGIWLVRNPLDGLLLTGGIVYALIRLFRRPNWEDYNDSDEGDEFGSFAY